MTLRHPRQHRLRACFCVAIVCPLQYQAEYTSMVSGGSSFVPWYS
jgi:hypothetical protein